MRVDIVTSGEKTGRYYLLDERLQNHRDDYPHLKI